MVEKIKAKDMTEFDGPVDTGDPHAKRAADKRKVGDMEADTSVSKTGKKGADLPGTTTVGEEVAALFADVEGLSEDFVTKASTIFEGAVSEKISDLREEFETEYNQKLDEAYDSIAESLEESLDQYLNLFVENYLEQNKVAIERGFRQEIAESVIENIVSIVESAGVDLPEEKIDVADALVAENEELEAKYNESLNENIELRKTIRKFEINEAFNTHTEGLTEASKDKLRKLTENVEYSSVEQFVEKLEILKESVSGKTAPDAPNLTEASDDNTKPEVTDSRMAAYLKASRGLSEKSFF